MARSGWSRGRCLTGLLRSHGAGVFLVARALLSPVWQLFSRGPSTSARHGSSLRDDPPLDYSEGDSWPGRLVAIPHGRRDINPSLDGDEPSLGFEPVLLGLGGIVLQVPTRSPRRSSDSQRDAGGHCRVFMLQKGVYLAIALALAAAISPAMTGLAARLKKCSMLLAAFACPPGTVLLFYAAKGQLGSLIYATVVWPLRSIPA